MKAMDVMAKVARLMWIPILVAALYTGWIFWQRRAVAPPSTQIDPYAKYGDRVRILQFYAESTEIARGQKTLLCYGVVNAKTMRLDPPEERVWPAVSRCFEVAPSTTTRYTLTAEGVDRATASESIEIAVKR
jgi:hypothetical protein